MKKKLNVTIPRSGGAFFTACGFMVAAAVIRLVYFLGKPPAETSLSVHLFLPVAAAVVFLVGAAAGQRWSKKAAILAVVLGVTFFIIKAQTFAPLHRALCTTLYLTVLVLFTATLSGLLPTKKLLYPLFGLPLLYHIFVEDTQLYLFAQPPVPYWEWLPELSVLCIMAGLLSLSIALKAEKA